MCACMHACMYVCMYVYMHVCMDACVHARMYVLYVLYVMYVASLFYLPPGHRRRAWGKRTAPVVRVQHGVGNPRVDGVISSPGNESNPRVDGLLFPPRVSFGSFVIPCVLLCFFVRNNNSKCKMCESPSGLQISLFLCKSPRARTHTHIHYTYVYIHTYTYIYIYIY